MYFSLFCLVVIVIVLLHSTIKEGEKFLEEGTYSISKITDLEHPYHPTSVFLIGGSSQFQTASSHTWTFMWFTYSCRTLTVNHWGILQSSIEDSSYGTHTVVPCKAPCLKLCGVRSVMVIQMISLSCPLLTMKCAWHTSTCQTVTCLQFHWLQWELHCKHTFKISTRTKGKATLFAEW